MRCKSLPDTPGIVRFKNDKYLSWRLDQGVRIFVNGDVQVHGAFGQLKPEQNRLAVQRSPRSDVDQKKFGRMHSKFEPAVI
jgi:hypothetical protein